MTSVAVIGLGAMGSRMAMNLLNGGYELRIWNRTPGRDQGLREHGAIVCATPKEAVAKADSVITMLMDDEASQDVWLAEQVGGVYGLRSGCVVIECSTISAQWCKELAGHVQNQGADFLDAPVIGSRPQAEAGQLIHLLGGDAAVLDKVRDVLKVNAAMIHHVGGTGAGMTMKLAANALFGTQVAALGETIGMLKKAGISVKQSVNLLNELPTTSPVLKAIGLLIEAENYAALFPINLVEKDLGYLVRLSDSVKSEIPVLEMVREIYQRGKAAGFGKDNIAGIVQLYR